MMNVSTGHRVEVHYTGKLDSGEVFDSSDGRDPLSFVVGRNSVIPGFEKAVIGLAVDQERSVTVPSEEAYGDHEDSRVFSVERERLSNIDPELGMHIGLQLENGQRAMAVIAAFNDENITLDLNHPLAGKNLHFTVRVVDIQEAGEENEECDSGSCQSCSGCGHDHG